ncbi:MAG: terephthalate 1,2-dioxygenase [Betaproteobacteria bacterium]|nr:terephthalate 1,2-dioxygenase [Betaproteobacteria bacterium]
MIDLMTLCAFNAAYAFSIDSDSLETWPLFFTDDALYRITHIENENENLPAGIVYADSRNMLIDRIAALRLANIYERQRYRHILGIPAIVAQNSEATHAHTPFMVARIMATGQTDVFATGFYKDVFVANQEPGTQGNALGILLKERVAVCDSTVTDTLLALPL